MERLLLVAIFGENPGEIGIGLELPRVQRDGAVKIDDGFFVVIDIRRHHAAHAPGFRETRCDIGDRFQNLARGRHIARLRRGGSAHHQQIDAGAAGLVEQRENLRLDRLGGLGRSGLGELGHELVELLDRIGRKLRRRIRRKNGRCEKKRGSKSK